MAIAVTFTGFLQEVKHFDWGTVVEVAHTNRKKNQAGQWETTSTDYIDVVIDIADKEAYRSIFELAKSTRLTVAGNMKFNVYTKRDGEAGAKMKVWAHNIEVVGDVIKPIKDILSPVDAPF
jgi:single-stranded DNA-binding protein